MNAVLRDVAESGRDIADRIAMMNWDRAASELDAQGCAVLPRLLSPQECGALAALYPTDEHFRSRVVMGRHGFGRGEYKYFSYPLPETISQLRASIYPQLQPIANRWNAAMGVDVRYPAQHSDY